MRWWALSGVDVGEGEGPDERRAGRGTRLKLDLVSLTIQTLPTASVDTTQRHTHTHEINSSVYSSTKKRAVGEVAETDLWTSCLMELCSQCWSSEVEMQVQRTTDEPCDPRQCSSCLRALVEVMDHAWWGFEKIKIKDGFIKNC